MAIHQPTFFPWLGYFDKIARADVFVVLDHVQFPKSRPGSWMNRVQLPSQGRALWFTVPVERAFEGVRRIDEIRIDARAPWRRRLLQWLRTTYGRAPAFDEVFPVVVPLVEHPAALLADYNLHAIGAIGRRLGLATDHLVRSSTLGVEGRKTELLVAIVRCVGGTTYLAGGGAGGYQEDERFADAGLEVQYQRFVHPVYAQHGVTAFLPGLSVLDALFNCGFEGTARLLAAARGDEPGR